MTQLPRWCSFLLLAALFLLAVTLGPGWTAHAVSQSPEISRSDDDNGREEVRFGDTGHTGHGDWLTHVSASPRSWQPGAPVTVETTLVVTGAHLASLAAAGIRVDGFCLLVTAERTFDADGWLRLPSDERMSTLVTPTGLPIEGGVQGAVTTRFGYWARTPLDEFMPRATSQTVGLDGQREVVFRLSSRLPDNLPPGIYRLRLDYGVTVGTRYFSLTGESFSRRPAAVRGRATESHIYSPPLRASGRHVSGRMVDAEQIQPRIPWVLLHDFNSNGYRGVVAEEDKQRFAIASRNLMQDDVILPMFSDSNARLSYTLEPRFLTDTIELRNNIPWDFAQGELSIQVKGPDGVTTDLGTAPFVAKRGQWPTTNRPAFTAWRPNAYGLHEVKASGWLADVWGNRYEGGGTYRFWIAKRMTLATATFQGLSYPVGNRYGRDIGFAPAVPADVEIEAKLFVNSDVNNVRTLRHSGKASPGGLFTAAQGMQVLPFDAPGEYYGHVLARHMDRDGHLWVASVRHAGVVYPPDSPIVARGKKLRINNNFVDTGDTRFEGYVDTTTNTNFLAHINFPYRSGDVLLIASDGQGANKIEPVLFWENKERPAAYDARLQGVGATNLRLVTSNGYSPHLFPEYITEWGYFYAAAPRPGFMSRFLVGEDGLRAPYWSTSPNSFGGQINASSNGDLPGDIYRLIGGVVLRRRNETPLYAGYLASAFILPRKSQNNRIITAGSEELVGPEGRQARFFLVGLRPGMVYEVGTSFAPAVQVDPIVPARVTFTLEYPDGRRVVNAGVADGAGSWVGSERWSLNVPGVYRYQLEADWQGHAGAMPGLPPEGGFFYVLETHRPINAPALRFNLNPETSFPADAVWRMTGQSTAQQIHYAALIPGAAIAQGVIPVSGGRFEFAFDPVAISQRIPIYDVVNRVTNRPEIRDVIHLTFFSREVTPTGDAAHSFVRLIIRGNRVFYLR